MTAAVTGDLVHLTQSGGFAGLRREWTIEDSPHRDKTHWKMLIDECPWNDQVGDGHPDGYRYTFTAGDQRVVVPENELLGPWRTLADEIRRWAGTPEQVSSD